MRTTFRIDDDLLERLKQRALQENTSVSKLLNGFVRQGLAAKPVRRSRYRQRVFEMGVPAINLDKALSISAEEEDLEVIRKLQMRK